MSDQIDLFTAKATPEGPRVEVRGAYARHTDPNTSKAAARRVDVNRLEQKVLDALASLGGSGNNNEICQASGLDWKSQSPRMKPLEKKGLVRRTDEKRDRQIVWRLAP